MTEKVSPRMPQPSGPSIPASVYTSVSRSAEIGMPYMWSSSPTLPMTVSSAAVNPVLRERAVRAPPTPPASRTAKGLEYVDFEP